MNTTGPTSIQLAVASASDVLCLEVATHLAEAVDGVAVSGAPGLAEWSASATDASGRPRTVEIARVPFERDAIERRRSLLERADVVLLVADAMMDAMPIAQAAIAELRSSGGDQPAPLVVFGIGPSAGGGPDAEAIRQALGLDEVEVVIGAGSSDRERLQLAFALALRTAKDPAGSATSTVATPPAAPPTPVAPPTEPSAGAAAPPTPSAEPVAPVDPVDSANSVVPSTGTAAGTAPVAPFGVELNPAVAASGTVEMPAAVWAALTELVGGIDPAGDPHRSLLVSGLLAHGIVVERHEIAGADAMWIQPVMTPGTTGHPAARPSDTVDTSGELRDLKDLRQHVVG